jgi:DNA-binding NarL/FixJ family response regulator
MAGKRCGVIPLAVIDENALFRRGLRVGLQEAGFPAEESNDLLTWARLGGERSAIVTTSGANKLTSVTQARAINPDIVVVVIAERCTARCFAEALKAGAAACISRSSSFEELIDVMRMALRGVTAIPTHLARSIVTAARVAPNDCPVSPREASWISVLAHGGTVTKLAHDSGYSEREMYRILHQIYDRMGARNRAEALVRAAGWGLID